MRKVTATTKAVAFGLLLVLGLVVVPSSLAPADDASQYSIFVRPPDEFGGTEGWVGDVMPFYDNGQFHVYYLHENRPNGDSFHPWYEFTTTDFGSYQYEGEAIGTGTYGEQDLCIGSGSVIKNGPIYYAFYTGHNWQFPDSQPREGIMLAATNNLASWSKQTSFTSLTAPGGSLYDEDNFRDPFVFSDPRTGGYTMLVSTELYSGGTGMLAEYRSSDLLHWTIEPAPFAYFAGEPIPEVSNVFEIDGTWYLSYSKPAWGSDRGVYYRTSSSLDGPWSAETSLDGRGFYAGGTVSDGTNRYIAGWVCTREGETNSGDWQWAGNLVVHQVEAMPDGSLSLSAPAGVAGQFALPKTYGEVSRFGTVVDNGNDYILSGTAASINFDPINGTRKITGQFSYQAGIEDFGFTLGGSENRIVFFPGSDEIAYGDDIRVDIDLQPSTTYDFTLIEEGTVGVLYVADPSGKSVAATIRNYTIQGDTWGLFSKGGQIDFTDLSLFSIGKLQPGDFDQDGDVDGRDILLWQRNQSVGNLSDWLSNFGYPPASPSATAVPEPASAVSFLLGSLLLGLRRNRRR